LRKRLWHNKRGKCRQKGFSMDFLGAMILKVRESSDRETGGGGFNDREKECKMGGGGFKFRIQRVERTPGELQGN